MWTTIPNVDLSTLSTVDHTKKMHTLYIIHTVYNRNHMSEILVHYDKHEHQSNTHSSHQTTPGGNKVL